MNIKRFALWHYSRLVVVVMRVSVAMDVGVSMRFVGATMRVSFCHQAEHTDQSEADNHEEQLDQVRVFVVALVDEYLNGRFTVGRLEKVFTCWPLLQCNIGRIQ